LLRGITLVVWSWPAQPAGQARERPGHVVVDQVITVRPRCVLWLTQRLERRPELGREQFGLFPGGKVATGGFVEVDDVRVEHRGRRRPAARWIVHVISFVALAVGVLSVLPRLGGLTRDAADLRYGRPAFMAAFRLGWSP
jgi:hypothetical protein